MSNAMENFEFYYGVVLKGRLSEIAKASEYLKNFCDIYFVFDKTSPIKLYITEKPERGDKPK